jgi:hypothetical protein
MVRFKLDLIKNPPDLILLVGDVTSTIFMFNCFANIAYKSGQFGSNELLRTNFKAIKSAMQKLFNAEWKKMSILKLQK